MNNRYLTNLFEGRLGGTPFDEIFSLIADINPDIDLSLIREIHNDLVAFFSGAHPEFQKNNLPYHNLRHSQMVVLATIRLFDGLHSEELQVTHGMLLRGFLAAYFHDAGMLLVEGDSAVCGTEYMAGHEARSIVLLKQYACRKGFDPSISRDCATIINYTDLYGDPATLEGHPHEIQLVGRIVGSADILAQMADRYYLEGLPSLYHEMNAGGVSRHNSAIELMEHTVNFYRTVVLKRLYTTFSHAAEAMQVHFRKRYGIDRNLYLENIDKNISYLDEIIVKCREITCLEQYLRRRPPVI
jgi:hypothetical protein